jgi:hypothetical protein
MGLRSALLLFLVTACAGSSADSSTGSTTKPGSSPAPPPPPRDACKQEEALCILQGASGAKYDEHAVTSEKDLALRGKGNPGEVEFDMEMAHASLFVNGRYAGTAPIEQPIPIPAGKNDIHIRAGRELVTKGVLTVPADQPMRVKVRRR